MVVSAIYPSTITIRKKKGAGVVTTVSRILGKRWTGKAINIFMTQTCQRSVNADLLIYNAKMQRCIDADLLRSKTKAALERSHQYALLWEYIECLWKDCTFSPKIVLDPIMGDNNCL